MSESIKSLLLERKNIQNQNIPVRFKQTPAEKNINYYYMDSISYNLIENMTMFKNSEINKEVLNQRLIGNLSLFLAKGAKDKNNKCSIKNFGIYFPVRRITCLEENNKKYRKKNNKNSSNQYIDIFRPLGRDFLNIKNKRNLRINSTQFKNEMSNEILLRGKNSKDISFNQGSSDNNSISLLSEESLSNKDIIKISDKDLIEHKRSTSSFRNLKQFRQYKELVDFMECPLINRDSNTQKYNNFCQLLDNIDDYFDSNGNDFNKINENLIIDEELDIPNYSTVYITNFDQINYLHEQIKNKIHSSQNYEDRNNKSSTTLKFKNFNRETLKNDLSETMDKTLSSMNQNKNKILDNRKNKSEILSKSLKSKYLKIMNEHYISLLHKIYLDIMSKCINSKTYFMEEIMVKKLFVQLFKEILLKLSVANKKTYEKILKNQIFHKKLLTFDQFIQCFDILIHENNDSDKIKEKISFLFNLLSLVNHQDFINSKNVELFFELLSCDYVYIQDFCENLGEKLVLRYNAVYESDEEENIELGLYKFKKMMIILQTFFDELQIED